MFWLENYAALDRLFSGQEDPVCAACRVFFISMDNVEDRVRQEVRFRLDNTVLVYESLM